VGEGEAYARTRRESLQSEQTRATGESNLRSLAPGYLITLARCPRAEQNTEHLIVGTKYELKSNAHGMSEHTKRGAESERTTLAEQSHIS
jgi:type VI secretion system secreted protein VgrG